MKTAIKEICTIQTGLFAKPSGQGEVVYLQAKHFDENGNLLGDLYPDLLADYISTKHLLQDGDVLFAAKGTKNFAVVFENHNEPSVASTSFFVLKTTSDNILPNYLAWYLNRQSSQTVLKGQAIGTSIPSISKQVLENFEITVPNIETQRAILQITQLRDQEKTLRQQIEILREKQIQQKISNTLN